MISLLPIIGEYQILSIYDYFDKPLLFSVKNNLDNIYVISFASSKPQEEKWIASQVSRERLEQLEAGVTSIRHIFEKPESGFTLLFTIQKSSEATDVVIVSEPFQQIAGFLAEPDEFVDPESIEISEADDLARRNLPITSKVFVNLCIDKNRGSRSTLNAKVLGDMLSSFQETVNNIGMNISGIDNERGRVPLSIFEATSLDYAVGWNGSVGITLFSRELSVLIPDNLVEESLIILSGLLSNDTIDYFAPPADQKAQALSRRTLLKFKSFLASLRLTGADFEMTFESRSGVYGHASISESEIHSKINQVESYANHSERFYSVIARITSVNSTTGRIELVEVDTDVAYYAYVRDENYFRGNMLSVPGLYKVAVIETVSVNKNTGEEITSYYVISFAPVESTTVQGEDVPE